MIRFEYTETIAASPAEIFAVMSDIGRFDEWLTMDGRPTDPGPVRVGSRFDSTGRLGPLPVELQGTITSFEPGRRFGFRTVKPNALDFEITVDLEATPDGTTILKGHGTMRLSRLWRLFEPIMRMELDKGEAAEAARLKALLEGTPMTVERPG